MLESLFVALIVLAAAAYAAYALLPSTTRRNLALRAARTLGGPQAAGVSGRLSSTLQRIAKTRAGGCSDCPAAGLTPAERAGGPKQPR